MSTMGRCAKPIVIFISGVCCALVGALDAHAQPLKYFDEPIEPTPPANQEYIGFKRCASCHMEQYRSWAKTTHAEDAWEEVPKPFRTDPRCLTCHATGYGGPGGFKDAASTPNLTGTACEACHGPGSKHQEICKPLMAKEGSYTVAEEKLARDSIWRVRPQNACRACHNAQAHKEHPEFDRGGGKPSSSKGGDPAKQSNGEPRVKTYHH